MAQIMKAEILELRGSQRLLPVPIEVHELFSGTGGDLYSLASN
jgi:hypothetical protein